jgi:opacity protein-like surface antigen
MKRLHVLLASLAVLSSSAPALTAETYVRAGAGYFAFTDSHYDDKAGATLAIGTVLGSQGSHEIQFEADLVAWEGRWTPGSIPSDGMGAPIPVAGGVTTDGNGHLLPVLLGYRFRTGSAESTWRFYVGASAGATHITGDLSSLQSLPPPYGNKAGSVSSWRATYGAAAGVEIRLAPRLTLDIGYRYRGVDGPSVTMREVKDASVTATHDLGKLSTHVAALNLGWRF